MSARQLLDQLLRSGQDLAQQATGRDAGQGGGSFLAGLGGGALGAGALGLLLGSKKARKVGGKVAMYGGMAALGALAYRAYGQWQENQARQAQAAAPAPPRTLDRLPAPEAEAHSNAVLVAMIGAAKADGHIGPAERQLLEQELIRLSGDAADRGWLEAELARPVDPAAVARAARTPEMAAEMYLASVLVIDEESFMERAYLDELARQLKLEPALKQQLEAQVAQLS
ncbi:tellurite resistance TerB family protein [Bordetella hinzii]|uniref:DUF533 domain-containing protein n=2 Tax=Bordetella hinzii TaxID=103855 RepID=A0AAN1RXE2_9BORD|nr:tellurite resistance TerB family protein [Bordetella hinzii]AKQ57301.1 Inner membrane protein YebE [Bordetella hinzii]AKQ61768.1 Inner membrane protein YebE [Bordetella hinzii]AZW17288.1 DUF533 domain-containing protein [Bordetella hinzii]KCB22880.1 PF04391 family protein [Bordetella hinzii OH87 BAL007II]KCB27226.1 PF04391 family protein [Bordetella hinzii CA90 BAL1384]